MFGFYDILVPRKVVLQSLARGAVTYRLGTQRSQRRAQVVSLQGVERQRVLVEGEYRALTGTGSAESVSVSLAADPAESPQMAL